MNRASSLRTFGAVSSMLRWRQEVVRPNRQFLSFLHMERFPRGGALPPRSLQRAFSTKGNTTTTTTTAHHNNDMSHRAFIAVGSNLGDRHQNIERALSLLLDPTFDSENYVPSKLVRTSFLHNTAPMYVTDQPDFLNGAVEIYTELSPHSLLQRLKKVEHHLGRNFTQIRNGPRPIDLDVLFYDDVSSEDGSVHYSPVIVDDSPSLLIPHPRIQERDFVLAPLAELVGDDFRHPTINRTIGDLFKQLQASEAGPSGRVRVLPLLRGRMIYFNDTVIMGILNVTPDSFSDGGKWNSDVDVAVERALEMEQEGAGIIDIGGESTRPGAKEISIDEQIKRTVPVIEKIRSVSDIPISIDTRHAPVARAAIEAGADIVNDVSGGTFDEDMLPTVADLGVPIILMHMRGTPESMRTMTEYDDVVQNVADALMERSLDSEAAGIPRWMQIVDPGIGFAKDVDGNLELLRKLEIVRSKLGGLPILLGTSRKGFIGEMTGVTVASERDFGSVASSIAALCLDRSPVSCDLLRVHNVKGTKQAAVVMDAIRDGN
jgi:dihydropteroate synthase/2-amino-4-hydroxy-6-hydroxymethyldihydropteridine diphosphokinase